MKTHLKNDILLITALLLCAVISFLLFRAFRTEGKSVIITRDGHTVGVYSLDEDRTIDLITNKVVIENGEVYVKDADCPDKICEKAGRLRYAGETAVCLPNRIAVEILGNDGADAYVN